MAGWRLVDGRLTAGWRLAGGRGRQQEGNSAVAPHHETAKTAPNTQNSRSSSTKTSILCSKCPKTGVSKAKSAQKPRFCARNALKRGFWKQKSHKNPDFVLEMPENGGSDSQKRTKTSILCSKRLKTRLSKPKKEQKPRFCAREESELASGGATVAFLQITEHASKMQMSNNQIINFYQRAR